MAYLPRACLLFVLAGLGFALYHAHEAVFSKREEQVGVAATVGLYRPFQPRLSGDFVHAPCRKARRSDRWTPPLRCSSPTVLSKSALRRLNQLRRDGDESVPSSRHLRGVATLLLGHEEGEIDRAIRRLEAALGSQEGDAGVLSDLAAAYLIRASESEEPMDLLTAAELADQAVGIDPRHRAARYNLALSLASLGLASQSEAAWDAYISVETDPEWRQEALEQRDSLRQQAADLWEEGRPEWVRALQTKDRPVLERLARRFPQEVREYAEIELIDKWAEDRAGGAPEAEDQRLRFAERSGEVLAEGHGELFVLDTVRTLLRAKERGERQRLGELIAGHADLAAGFGAYRDGRIAQALPLLRSARRALRLAGSPARYRAALYLGCALDASENPQDAIRIFEALRHEPALERYKSLRGHLYWMIGLLRLTGGHPVDALSAYQKALAAFQDAGETAHVVNLHTLLAESLDYLGRGREAWNHRYSALARTGQLRNPRYRYMAYTMAADFLGVQDRNVMALYFQKEAVPLAFMADDVTLRSEALRKEAQIYERLGQSSRALDAVSEARKLVAPLGEEGAAKDRDDARRAHAELAVAEGQILLEEDPARAVELLTQALGLYRLSERRFLALTVLRLRANAYRRLSRFDLAADDLREAIEGFEAMGEDVALPEVRNAFSGHVRKAYDEMISFQSSLGNPAGALEYAERAQSRALPSFAWEIPGEGAARRQALPPLGVKQIRDRLPAGTTLLEYSIQEEQILSWLVQGDRVEAQRQEIRQEDLRRLVRRFRDSSTASRDGRGFREASGELFELLVRPWWPQLRTGELVVFVPDKELYGLSFASLLDRQSGRYLVQDHASVVAPSAEGYLRALERAEALRRPWSESRLLAVGNPSFNRAAFPLLENLPQAADEVIRIGGLYEEPTLLTGSEATRDRFLALTPRYDLVHYAGHAVFNGRNPLLSALLLAADSSDPARGTLYAYEIYHLPLSATRLVVLSGCDTGNSFSAGTESVSGLARAFLAAGVPSVVASLWPVEDRAAADFFVRFHRHLLTGSDPASALQQAQLELAAEAPGDARALPEWSAFQVFGSS